MDAEGDEPCCRRAGSRRTWTSLSPISCAPRTTPGNLNLPDPDNPSARRRVYRAGDGKLGARELNYSSDIDLVLLFDPAAPIYTERTSDHAMVGFAARIARGLVTLMETRDANGYVSRTDLGCAPTRPRLRRRSRSTAITYYESMGQNWDARR